MDGQVWFTACLLLIVGSFLSVTSHDEEGRTVHTPMGKIKGSILKSRRGRTIYTFRGIPFAQQPVGQLRFKPPQPLAYYTDTVDATEEGPACPQPTVIKDTVSEDCLRLNVYSAELPRKKRNPRTPVLVFFHPGGFYVFSGVSALWGPQYLLDHDIVLVTVNYRLASLGFLSTGTKESPGNNGLKDQVEALRWIKKNIAAFGGDPDLVTISGYSIGSTSVGLHMMSPMSKGLFHRAIAMSGSPTSHVKYLTQQLDVAEKQAQLVNCPTTSPKAILDCLMTKSSVELGESLPGFYEIGSDPVFIWRAVIEPDFGQERFLAEDPYELAKNGNFYSVPLLTGFNEFETSGQAFSILMNDTLRQEYDTNWEKIAPIAFLYERDTEHSKFISRELRKFYLGDGPLENNNETAFALGRLYSDAHVSFASHRFANLMAQNSKCSVYYYFFSYKGRYSFFYYPGTQEPIGPVHHDDLLYLFNVSLLFPSTTLDAPESFMVDRLTTMWVNFATYGNPTPYKHGDSVTGNFKWPKLTESNKLYVDNGNHLVIKQGLFEERLQLWEWLFPL